MVTRLERTRAIRTHVMKTWTDKWYNVMKAVCDESSIGELAGNPNMSLEYVIDNPHGTRNRLGPKPLC